MSVDSRLSASRPRQDTVDTVDIGYGIRNPAMGTGICSPMAPQVFPEP